MNLFNTEKWYIQKIELSVANEYVKRYHRHHNKVVGHKFSIGVYYKTILVGVAICGRPVSRRLDNSKTLEIYRICTVGTKNAVSKLCSYVIKYAKLKGYEKVITYTFMSENGSSLKASNFVLEKENAGGLFWTGKREHKSKELKKRWSYTILKTY